MEPEKIQTSLPENAYRELKPGEEYTPVMPASSNPKEVTPYSVTMGVVMAVVFSAAAAFLGLKVGQVFEAAIPIAIIAVGMGSVLGKKNMLGQNVIIQSIGASSGVIVAGAIFTLPALYILGLDAAFWQVFLSSLFGGLLGIVLLIPFRKYFVKEMHGKYPFPEATATTEVLVSGEKGGSQAKLLAVAGLVGGLYDFVVGTFGLWTESVSTRICEWGAVAADKFKVVFGLNTSAAVLGLGYIIGLKYAMIITAGSCLVWFVIVPVVGSLAEAVDPAAMLSLLGVTRADIVADPQSIFTAENLFAFIGKPIGIGGIAMAGIIGIIRQSKIIRQAVGLAVSEFGGGKSAAAAPERTQRDISMKRILTILIATLISVFVFFHFGLLGGDWTQSLTAILIVFVWIGGLKFQNYEAEGIVPFVANSPFMSFFYTQKAPEYKNYKLKEGEFDAAKHEWHVRNNTYGFSHGLGILIMAIGVLVFLGIFSARIGLAGAILAVIMTVGTLSFLVTTPEVWVPDLGSGEAGFPLLSGAGRLVVKDTVILAGALVALSDSARRILRKRNADGIQNR